jgi:molecular chaperone HscB
MTVPASIRGFLRLQAASYNAVMAEDAFELLGLPRRYEIDRHQLEAAFLRRSAAMHPDRFPDPLRQAEAEEASAKLNDARALLLDDERRANELLRLLGGPAKDQDNSLPNGFLVDMMDVRQDMEQALASGDPRERERLERWALDQRAAYRDGVAALFEQVPLDAGARRSVLSQIRQQLNAWRYIERMIEQIDPA